MQLLSSYILYMHICNYSIDLNQYLVFEINNNQGKMADDNNGDVLQPLQSKLKSLLEFTVTLVRPRLKTKSQLAKFQQILIDYHSNEQLVEIIDEALKMLNQVLPKAKGVIQDQKPKIQEDEYLKLEQNLQLYESKVRAYIKNEHQLKLYCDELQAKNKELEEAKHDLVMSTKKVILDLKRDNQDLVTKLRQSMKQEAFNSENKNVTIQASVNNFQEININSFALDKNDSLEQNKSQNKSSLLKKGSLSRKDDSRPQSRKKEVVLEKISSDHKKKLQIHVKNGDSVEPSRSRRGSVSSLKIRRKK